MPLEVHIPQPHCQTASRYQFDFSHPSTAEERFRRSPELWHSQPCGTISGFAQITHQSTRPRRSQDEAVPTRESKEVDEGRLKMRSSYDGYGATHQNVAYNVPLADHNRKYSVADSAIYGAIPPALAYQSLSQPVSRAASKPASPVFQPVETASKSRGSIVSYLQIPLSISSSRGSLAEFAAQITCLFWFESSTTLSQIEDSGASPITTTRLVPEAFPATGFLKWVTTILSTTQVTQNVILLALLFVYRLKKQNPTVKGKPGSEFRLLTVALMLGNKFLDDNTYTNKTWAEVSGISFQEIHVMEVEFLSHMKYNLYTSADEWHAWHKQLSNFWKYFDRASRRPHDINSQRLSVVQIPPTLPSPPSSTGASPPYPSSGLPSDAGMQLKPIVLPPYLASLTPSPSVYNTDLNTRNGSRKRSWDSTGQEPPAKRMYNYHPYGTPVSNAGHAPTPETNGASNAPCLSVPALPLPQSATHGHYAVNSSTYPPSARPTPLTYSVAVDWTHGLSSAAPHSHHSQRQPSAQNDTLARPSLAYPPSAKHLSPIGPTFVSATSHTPAQSQLSPSHFLTQRSSPYRPVRDISTLLVPPPAGPLFHPGHSIPHEQMHWQTLGKNVQETKSGRVPYLHRDAWPQSHQVEHWPTLYPINMQG